MDEKIITLNGKPYTVKALLGKGKGGYSYLVSDGAGEYVLKQIHHEPCAYYNFGDKLQAELGDYKRLKGLIPIPELLDVDVAAERILKQYIAGETAAELIKKGCLPAFCLDKVRAMCDVLYAAGLNIDYYPTNFVPSDGELYYIDYECNTYADEWNFENWGKKYWIDPSLL